MAPVARCGRSPKALLQHAPSLEAPARPASLPSASAELNLMSADAQARRRDDGDAADQAAILSGLVHAYAMPVQLDRSCKLALSTGDALHHVGVGCKSSMISTCRTTQTIEATALAGWISLLLCSDSMPPSGLSLTLHQCATHVTG